ncbi:SDR family oxidoreductase [Hymenobacter guriensis]|uniref:SDR family NAD(P)-dependent oxidoreductase n=1 Tax=Hymenobacter guriensis TaxID=2793065 RepID=A0ABS0L2L7_9BACT|nr:SDR family NAD(P)-dependent oxidoreductase [Hymenobacter guriensis]MBG8554366.1 SDR family NAD(P)-dependent oxidoreductase [Hymenobacter guriensis]
MNLRHQTILITGGTSGLGYEFAVQLLALGNTVLLTGRDPGRLAQVQQQLPGVHTFQSDVSDLAAIARLYEQVTAQFPKLSVLINNAGQMRKLDLQADVQLLPDLTLELDVNLAGPMHMVQQFLPHLLRQPAAAILNVTSGLALTPYPLAPVYSASKAGLRAYTKTLRVQLHETKVQVFELVAPAAKTPLSDTFAGDVSEKDLMAPRPLIAQTIKAMQANQWEVYPGMAAMMRLLSRLAPGFLLRQLSKGVRESLARG